MEDSGHRSGIGIVQQTQGFGDRGEAGVHGTRGEGFRQHTNLREIHQDRVPVLIDAMSGCMNMSRSPLKLTGFTCLACLGHTVRAWPR